MGLLDALMRSGQSVKRNARGLLNDPSGTMGLLATRLGEDAQAYTQAATESNERAKQFNYDPVAEKKLIDQSMNVVGMAPLNMIAYHGSPHKFDKFDMSKIGTGEGAQAYGHGLYFAENKNTAKYYQEELSKSIRGHELDAYVKKTIPTLKEVKKVSDELSWLDDALPSANGDYDMHNALKYLGDGDNASALPYMLNIQSKYGIPVNDFANKFSEGIELSKLPKGSLYKVDIPDEAIPRMLDWDKPLSEQGAEVQAALKNAGLFSDVSGQKKLMNYKDKLFSDFDSGAITREQRNSALSDLVIPSTPETLGQSLYMRLGSQDKAAQKLKELGIPGVKYLDGYSRGPQGGSGTRNYVLFDDQLPKILERNGQPMGLLGSK